MKQPIIGILAGMGPLSTAPFLDSVIRECQAQYGAHHDIDFPKILILSQPTPCYEDRLLDRAAFEAANREGLQRLERAGASFLAIACNTSHLFHASLVDSVAIPVLNMVTTAVEALPAEAKQIAVVAARNTAESGIYQQALRATGRSAVPITWQAQVDALLGRLRVERDIGSLVDEWESLVRLTLDQGAQFVVVACLDLSAIAARTAGVGPVLDASHQLAREAVTEWLRRRDAVPQNSGMHRILAAELQGDRATPGPNADWSATNGEFTISTDPSRLDIAGVHSYLTRSYWAEQIPLQVVADSICHSLCFGLFDGGGGQVGFARVVTDQATFAYLCDVYVLEEHRGNGLGKWLVEQAIRHPSLRRVRRFLLVTRDAQSLYARFGFAPLRLPERFMEIQKVTPYEATR